MERHEHAEHTAGMGTFAFTDVVIDASAHLADAWLVQGLFQQFWYLAEPAPP